MRFAHRRSTPSLATLCVATATLLACAAAPAAAQDAITPGAITTYPTIQSVGVRLAYTGDADANATAHIEWRPQGSASWRVGVTMTRITNSRFAGSLMWLTADTPYDLRVVVDDPDGGGATVTTSVRTRGNPITAPTGATWWVAADGNDANSGSSSAPFATLAAAAAKANPGDQIRVRAGIYYQTLNTGRGGTATAPIHLVADGPGVILDGSDPAYLRRGDWVDEGGGVFSVPYTAATRLVAADSLQRLYHQADVASLQAGAGGIAQGWTVANGRLYVRLEDGSNPSGHVIHVARYNQAIFIQNPSWRMSGFEVRYYGLTNGGGIVAMNTDGVVITDNVVHTYGGAAGIYLRVGVTNSTVERNRVYDARISKWPWNSTKAHYEELCGILNRGRAGNVVRSNTVSGMFDGIDVNDGVTDDEQGSECDVHDNTITDLGDDATETDDIAAINLRYYRNTIDRVFSGISIAPNRVGPEYVLYNTVTNTVRGGFKFSLTGTGQTYICHNTVTSDVAGSPAVHPSGVYSNIHFLNNVMVGRGIASVSDDAGESATGNDFDHDLLWTDSSVLFRWKGVNYSSLPTLQSATGFERAGRVGNPLFMNPAGGDYRLQPGSPGVDLGVFLPGINDGYEGAAPDAGAFELAAGPDTIRPATIGDLR